MLLHGSIGEGVTPLALEKGVFESPSTKVTNFTFFTYPTAGDSPCILRPVWWGAVPEKRKHLFIVINKSMGDFFKKRI